MKSSSILSSAIIAVAIVVLGFSLSSALKHFADKDRVVAVRGLCEKEVQANKVTWPIVTKYAGNDLIALYNQIETNNATIVDFLTANGITSEEISLNAPEVYDQASDRYNSSNVRLRYSVTNVIVVTSDKIDAVRGLINRQTELMRKGIAVVAGDYNYQITYEYTKLNDIKPEMIAEATANAREAAAKFAQDSRSELGKISSASQGQFSISDRDQYTPNIKTVRVVTYITYYLKD